MSSEPLYEFREILESAGLVVDEIIADGNLHRCGTTGKELGHDGAYIFHPDPPAAGWYQNFRTGEKRNWKAQETRTLALEERKRLKARVEADKKARQRETDLRHADACEKATRLLSESEPAPSSHRYLIKKKIQAVGDIRLGRDGRLIISVLNAKGNAQSLQFVDDQGGKRFLPGGKTSGGFFPIQAANGSKEGPLYIVEGYATGATIHDVTRETVLVAFSAGNLMPVAEMARAQYPNRQIVICADDDHGTDGNPGLTKATEAARKIKAFLAIPKFAEPSGKSDFNDLAQAEGLEAVKELLSTIFSTNTTLQQQISTKHLRLEDWRTSITCTGSPAPREYLIDGVFPMGQASLLAAAGGVGKSFALLSMSLDIARCINESTNIVPPMHFGGQLKQHGIAVYLSAEDDAIEIHSRIHSLGGACENLIAVPYPSVGGAKTFFRMDLATKSPQTTPEWNDLCNQLYDIPELATVVIDPLQVFCALDLNAPENAQFVCSQISALAARTGAAVIISHHFRKTNVKNTDDARQSIRGSAGLVDGVRCAYALWVNQDEKSGKNAKNICRSVGVTYEPGVIISGAIVKSNGKASKQISTFVRCSNGIIKDITLEINGISGSPDDLATELVLCVAEAARQGRPYTRTGANGIFTRRHELGEKFSFISKHRLSAMAGELLNNKRLVLALAKGARAVQWLDIPSGPFAKGQGSFAPGHTTEMQVQESGITGS